MRRLVVIGVLFATACSSTAWDRPDSAVLDRLESALRSNPCIAPLARWSRSYGFERDPKSHSVDRRSVTFLYQEAGKFEFREGRHIFRAGELPFNIDDRSYRIAFGRYDLRSGKIEVIACGPNTGGA